jgi:hypothetical protein
MAVKKKVLKPKKGKVSLFVEKHKNREKEETAC